MKVNKFRIPIYEMDIQGKVSFKTFYNLEIHGKRGGVIEKDYEDLQYNNLIWKKEEQFVGCYDNNRKERYEGDIFKSQVCLSPDGLSSAHNIFYWIEVYCQIVFKDSCFVGEWKIENKKINNYIFSNRLGFIELRDNQEDIGNIHSSMELIK